MARDATRLPKEQHCPTLFRRRHRLAVATREPIDRCIRIDLCELKLRDGAREIFVRDRSAGFYTSGDAREQPPIVRRGIQATHHFGANVEVVTWELKTRCLDPFGRRNERLRDEQLRKV